MYTLNDKEGVADHDLERARDFNISYYDHIAKNDSKQDALAVFCLMELIVIRIKKDLPHVKTISFQSDNAKCYQAGELLLYCILIATKYGVGITRFIHTDTQDGKSAIDGHFAIAMKRVMALVDMGMNAVTSQQLVVLLNQPGGHINSIAELYVIDRNKVSEVRSQHSEVLASLKHVGRWNDAILCNDDSGRPIAKLFQYSGIDARVVNLYASASAQTEERDEDRDTGTSESEEGSDDEDDLFDCTGGDDDDDGDSSGASITGRVTGVRVVPSRLLRRTQRRLLPRKRETQVDLDDMQCDDDAIEECRVCHRQFSSAAMRERHACSGPRLKRDAVSYCVTKAVEMHRNGQIDVFMGAELTESTISWLSVSRRLSHFKAGWARRPAHGEGYGAKYAQRFSDELLEMFRRGVTDKSCKMCRSFICFWKGRSEFFDFAAAAAMVEELRRRHPDRFDIPSETEVSISISGMFKKWKDGNLDGPSTTSKRPRMCNPALHHITAIFVESRGTIKPAAAVLKLKQRLDPDATDGFPTDLQIKSKISAMKTKMKATQRLPEVPRLQ